MKKLLGMTVIMAASATWVFLSHKEPFLSHFRLLMLCALLSAGVLGGILGVIDWGRAAHRPPDDRAAKLRNVRKQYPGAVIGLVIIAGWLIFLKGETFGSFQSRLWLIVLGIGVSAGLWWAVPSFIQRWWHNNA